MNMFNLNNLIAGLIILLMMALSAKSETLPEINGIFYDVEVEFIETFTSSAGEVSSYYVVGDTDYCNTSIQSVIDDTGLAFVNTRVVTHPVTNEAVTAFYFSTSPTPPFSLAFIYSVSPGENQACLDIVMILRGEKL